MYYWTVDGAVKRWCILASRKTQLAGGAFREARGYVPGRYSEIFRRRTTRMYSEFGSFF